MTFSLQLNSYLAKTATWLADHPALVRVVWMALPIVIAFGISLLMHGAVYANPLGVGSGGTGS
jgi:hypothetical protein